MLFKLPLADLSAFARMLPDQPEVSHLLQRHIMRYRKPDNFDIGQHANLIVSFVILKKLHWLKEFEGYLLESSLDALKNTTEKECSLQDLTLILASMSIKRDSVFYEPIVQAL